jgi:hypothetical protein
MVKYRSSKLPEGQELEERYPNAGPIPHNASCSMLQHYFPPSMAVIANIAARGSPLGIRSTGPRPFVMHGLDPRIHAASLRMDCRVKPSNDALQRSNT